MRNIVLDLEWNLPNGPEAFLNDPIRLNGDIIEIGAVLLDDQYRPTDVFRRYVQPQYYRKLNRTVGNLTHIKAAELKDAPVFETAWKAFLDWCGEDPRFLLWSKCDMTMLRQNLRMRGMPCGLPPCCDLQEVFEAQIARDNKTWALTEALRAMRVDALTAHDAANDAVNTARLCACLDMDNALEYFTDFVPPVYDEAVSEGVNSPTDWVFPCPSCGGTVHGTPENRWGRGVAECPDCGSLRVRLKYKPLSDGRKLMNRAIRAMDVA